MRIHPYLIKLRNNVAHLNVLEISTGYLFSFTKDTRSHTYIDTTLYNT